MNNVLVKCDNCGCFFDPQIPGILPMFCPGCQDWIDWKREEDREDDERTQRRKP